MRNILIVICAALFVLNSTAVIAGFPSCQGIKDTHCKSAKAGDQYQCTTYVQQHAGWVGRLGTTQGEKTNRINCHKPNIGAPGSVVVMGLGSYGHVGLVQNVKGDTITITDRNACCDGQDRSYDVSVNDGKVLGFIVQDEKHCLKPGSSGASSKCSKKDKENCKDSCSDQCKHKCGGKKGKAKHCYEKCKDSCTDNCYQKHGCS